MSTKSHAKGKLVLCKYSVDDQWYRACVIETLQGNYTSNNRAILYYKPHNRAVQTSL